jgi:DEAD/DEAH box helicase domain-containing protein
LRGLAATNALELGIDISGLDAVVMAGWPGSRASFLQQSGRAGRRGQPATAVLVAREDPLDQYLVNHPEVILGAPVEGAAFDVANPYVMAPHLGAAAAELPLSDAEIPEVFGPSAPQVLEHLALRGLVRHRPSGWHWTCQSRASDLTDLRGAGDVVRIVEASTGKLLGTIDSGSALTQTHEGAIYTHQGLTYLVTELDLAARVAQAARTDVDYQTFARQVTQTDLGVSLASRDLGGLAVHVGEVQVIAQVTSYLKRRWPSGEVLGEFPLDLPATRLPTIGTWWVAQPEVLAQAGVDPADVPGTLHAAEHAAIGLLPLIATCDRWDIGGSSIAAHPQTGCATVVIYDGTPGGAGFARAGFDRLGRWWQATREAIIGCPCSGGCPACVQSPKCGSGNSPLDKAGAGRLLTLLTQMVD